MQNEFKEIKDNKEIIEKELISTKEKLGEVLNELSEAENAIFDLRQNNNTGNNNNKVEKKGKLRNFFSKKKD
jgi:hypothetical protein